MADFQPYQPDIPDWQQLSWFLRALAQLLEELHDARSEFFIRERNEDLGMAIVRAHARLRAVYEELGKNEGARLADGGEDHGLVGDELRFKLNNVHYFSSLYNQKPDTRHLRRLLDAIKTLLESILEALGVAGAIRETVSGMRDVIDDML